MANIPPHRIPATDKPEAWWPSGMFPVVFEVTWNELEITRNTSQLSNLPHLPPPLSKASALTLKTWAKLTWKREENKRGIMSHWLYIIYILSSQILLNFNDFPKSFNKIIQDIIYITLWVASYCLIKYQIFWLSKSPL